MTFVPHANDPKRILVTGGAGFIGSTVAKRIVRRTRHRVLVLDKLTYAGCPESLEEIVKDPRYVFTRKDICDTAAVNAALDAFQPDIVLNLAAESHVDRSIDGPGEFVRTNVLGTYVLLQAALRIWRGLDRARKASFRFHHVSTDEVYGALADRGRFREDTPYSPNSPYSASKAGSDHLVRAWAHTFGLPVIITNCSNNYGPYQFPEKLIPLAITNAMEGKPIPVYGRGENVRDWLYVDDHAEALMIVAERAGAGMSYNIGGGVEKRNIEVVEAVCDLVDELNPLRRGRTSRDLIAFVADRPGHDLRYAVDWTKIERELGWRPRETFDTGLRKTVVWYLENRSWWERIRSGRYRGERLGVAI